MQSLNLQPLKTPAGEAIQVTTREFLDTILPPLPGKLDANLVLRRWKRCYKNSSSQKPITLKGRWRGFPQDPAASPRSTKTSFKYFVDVVNAIRMASTTEMAGVSRRLQNNPHPVEMTSCDTRDYNSLPDAFLVSSTEKGTQNVDWWDVEVVGEYNKTEDEGEIIEASYRVPSSLYAPLISDLEYRESNVEHVSSYESGRSQTICIRLYHRQYRHEAVVWRPGTDSGVGAFQLHNGMKRHFMCIMYLTRSH